MKEGESCSSNSLVIGRAEKKNPMIEAIDPKDTRPILKRCRFRFNQIQCSFSFISPSSPSFSLVLVKLGFLC
ncbi:hypothetical protein RIF29_24779 [Crotalaria pallida]|uniref:Uncharacterized protein n=1 Tax=Crotalaria pallida TaxID=3830 RepID=A0AAN9HZ79_CROPI